MRKRSPIIRLENISIVYNQGSLKVKVLQDVSLTIEEGEYCSIMGSLGSGKFKAMSVIGCLESPTTGCYELDGVEVARMPPNKLRKIRNEKLGVLFQKFCLFPKQTVLDNVMKPMIREGIRLAEKRDRAAAALEKVCLHNCFQKKINQLSGEQQQRVAIAQAILNNPVLLLVNEPTGGLDVFTELNDNGMTIVMVTQKLEVARHTQRIVWFRDGRVLHSHLKPDLKLEQLPDKLIYPDDLNSMFYKWKQTVSWIPRGHGVRH